MTQTTLHQIIRKIKQYAYEKKYKESEKGKETIKRYKESERGKIILEKMQKRYLSSRVLLKTKSFTLFSDTEDNFHYGVRCVIQENETFRSRGLLADVHKRISNNNGNGEGLDKKKAVLRWQRHHHKRRGLGFIELNEHFDGSEGHHIDKEFVLHIPRELHRSIHHNIWSGKNMEEINNKAIEWAYGV